jgi:hypothetical protein
MVSVRPATSADATRTVAVPAAGLAELVLAEGVLLAGEPAAEAAVTPPTAATAARPTAAMMIFGFRMTSLPVALTTNYLLTRIVEVGRSSGEPGIPAARQRQPAGAWLQLLAWARVKSPGQLESTA